MTERLYYSDSTLREFTARVVDCREGDRGPVVMLDRTAFYPTSGGQPHDTGMVDDIPVLDVWEDDRGDIWHRVARPPQGEEVHGQIDWARRFDHMQQHTGQHLLSAAFVHVLEAPTVSFHLGSDESHIDLNVPALTWDAAFRVEADANRIITENRPVEIRMVDESEIHTVSLRRPPQVRGTIRVIRIPGYEAAACGGTHVDRTGAIGLLKITRMERYKGGMRVSFRCGRRALEDYQRALRALQDVSDDLSVHQDDVGDAVGRLKLELREARQTVRSTRAALMEFEAGRLLAEAREVDGVRRVIRHFENRSYDDAKELASQVCREPSTLALLAVTESKGVRLICQCAEEGTHLQAAAILQRAAGALGGQGGGTPIVAQGGAPPHPPEAVQQALEEAASG
jgi:alanyl-tRNA synthetase